MRGLLTEAALLAYGPALPDLPRQERPVLPARRRDRADGIPWECSWCLHWNRVIPEDSMRPGEHVTAACDDCGQLTEIIRRTAMFA
jgi:hypothetical protein